MRGGILSRDRPPRGTGLALDGNVTEAELRPARLAGSALCFTLFAVLAILVSTTWEPLQQFDTNLGTWPESFTRENQDVYLLWCYLGLATTTIPMAIAIGKMANRTIIRTSERFFSSNGFPPAPNMVSQSIGGIIKKYKTPARIHAFRYS